MCGNELLQVLKMKYLGEQEVDEDVGHEQMLNRKEKEDKTTKTQRLNFGRISSFSKIV